MHVIYLIHFGHEKRSRKIRFPFTVFHNYTKCLCYASTWIKYVNISAVGKLEVAVMSK